MYNEILKLIFSTFISPKQLSQVFDKEGYLIYIGKEISAINPLFGLVEKQLSAFSRFLYFEVRFL
jgi:hypothetical protein